MKKLVIVLCSVVIAAGAAVFFNLNTWAHYRAQSAQKTNSDARMRAAEDERARLLEEKAELESPRGREALARKQGYKRPGEEPLIVKD